MKKIVVWVFYLLVSINTISAFGNNVDSSSNHYNSPYTNRDPRYNNNVNSNNFNRPNLPKSSGFFPLGSDIRDRRPANNTQNPYVQPRNASPITDPYHPRYAYNPNYNQAADKETQLRRLSNDPNVSSANRGWIRQEMTRVDRNRDISPVSTLPKNNILRNPPGMELAHAHGRERAKGYGYAYTQLQNADLHKTQHQYDKGGKLNLERVPTTYQHAIGI